MENTDLFQPDTCEFHDCHKSSYVAKVAIDPKHSLALLVHLEIDRLHLDLLVGHRADSPVIVAHSDMVRCYNLKDYHSNYLFFKGENGTGRPCCG